MLRSLLIATLLLAAPALAEPAFQSQVDGFLRTVTP
jgi:hypothetical protein